MKRELLDYEEAAICKIAINSLLKYGEGIKVNFENHEYLFLKEEENITTCYDIDDLEVTFGEIENNEVFNFLDNKEII